MVDLINSLSPLHPAHGEAAGEQVESSGCVHAGTHQSNISAHLGSMFLWK